MNMSPNDSRRMEDRRNLTERVKATMLFKDNKGTGARSPGKSYGHHQKSCQGQPSRKQVEKSEQVDDL
jgi:hypothetical protein